MTRFRFSTAVEGGEEDGGEGEVDVVGDTTPTSDFASASSFVLESVPASVSASAPKAASD